MTTAMTRIQFIASQQSSQQAALNHYLGDHGISASLAVRVQQNAQHAYAEQKRKAPEGSIELLQLVSEPLRAELHFEMRGPLLLSHPFLECYENVNTRGVREVCHLAVSPLPVSHGDVIFCNLETPVLPRMFFVSGEGTMEYLHGSKHSPGDSLKLTSGSWVSEAVLWTSWMHRGQLRARTDCTLMALDAQVFQRILSPFPLGHAADYGESFVEALNLTSLAELTDLKTPDLQNCLACAFPEQWSAPRRLSVVLESCIAASFDFESADHIRKGSTRRSRSPPSPHSPRKSRGSFRSKHGSIFSSIIPSLMTRKSTSSRSTIGSNITSKTIS